MDSLLHGGLARVKPALNMAQDMVSLQTDIAGNFNGAGLVLPLSKDILRPESRNLSPELAQKPPMTETRLPFLQANTPDTESARMDRRVLSPPNYGARIGLLSGDIAGILVFARAQSGG